MAATFLDNLLAVFTPFGVRGGLICLASQCLSYLALRYLDTKPSLAGPWSRRAGFTAHQIVTLPVLSYLTYEGLYLWWFESSTADDLSPHHRLLGDHEHSQHLTEFVAGMMFFWDIPTSFLTRELRQPAMIAHHLVGRLDNHAFKSVFASLLPRPPLIDAHHLRPCLLPRLLQRVA